jgi:hypothetical protein
LLVLYLHVSPLYLAWQKQEFSLEEILQSTAKIIPEPEVAESTEGERGQLGEPEPEPELEPEPQPQPEPQPRLTRTLVLSLTLTLTLTQARSSCARSASD